MCLGSGFKDKRMSKPLRIGIYICHCGRNIAGYMDIPVLIDRLKPLHDVTVVRDEKYMCSDQGQEMIKKDLREGLIDRVIVASCSPTMHQRTFRKCVEEERFNPYLYQQVDIRENCSWVTKDKEEATSKAYELIKGGIWRVKQLEPLWATEYPVTPTTLVIGGGIAGITAATDVLDAGFNVVLVEREHDLGGWAARLGKGYPTLIPIKDFLQNKIEALQSHHNLKLYLSSEVTALEGFPGNFTATIKQEDGTAAQEEVGSIIVATGFSAFNARRKPEYCYGNNDQVITTVEMEELLDQGLPWGDGQPKEVAFIQCVGSRDKSIDKEYCSRVCCMVVAKQALLLKQLVPDAKISVFYMDVRSFGKGYEEFYEKAQRSGVLYIRGNPSELYKDGDKVVIRYEDTLLGRPQEAKADLVVLAVGMEPAEGTADLINTLRVTADKDGFFLEAHPKLGPLDTYSDGIFIAGCCQGPKDIPDTIAQAHGAAARATLYFHQGCVIKEPIIASVDEEVCAGCRLCEAICSFDALRFDEKKKRMTVQEAVCKGCGACAVTCPSGAMSLKHYRFGQMLSWVEGLLA
jgi:heterodisulfide reductase subunit A